MRTIDHSIRIPATQEQVWDYISVIDRNPEWQSDCIDIVFLTSRRDGSGLRWRYTTPEKREFVVETTAWYAGYGYEYAVIDGPLFREARGRIRIHETPDGTIVQWELTYQLNGFLGGMGGTHNAIERTIIANLRGLYDRIKRMSGSRPFTEQDAKSLMRDAPDVEARSAYKPRQMASALKTQPTETPAPMSDLRDRSPFAPPTRPIIEPPIVEDDTRPRPAVSAPTPPAVVVPDAPNYDPAFLSDLDSLISFEPPITLDDTQPRKPIVVPASDSAPESTVSESTVSEEPVPIEDAIFQPLGSFAPLAEPEVIDAPSPSTSEAIADQTPMLPPDEPIIDAPPVIPEPEPSVAAVVAPEPEPEVAPAPPVEELSIWERFGLARPSDDTAPPTPTIKPSTTEPSTEPTMEAAPMHNPIGQPRGWRAQERRRAVRVRRLY